MSETRLLKVIHSFRKFFADMFSKNTRRELGVFDVGLEKSVDVRCADPTEGKEDKKWLIEFNPENLGFRFLF